MAVNVDWDVVEGVEDLDKIFKKALARAEDADEPEIRQQWSESKAQFFEKRAQQAELRSAKRDALDKYPLAKRFESDIKGTSPAEIEASAKRFHEQVEAVTKEATEAKAAATQSQQDIQQQAQQQYGAPAAGGGGSQARPVNDLTAKEEAIQRVHAKLQRGEGLQRQADKMDAQIMGNERLRQAIDFQREPHPELGLGVGGSYRGEASQDRKLVDARVEARKAAARK
jgi:hypothetical protein